MLLAMQVTNLEHLEGLPKIDHKEDYQVLPLAINALIQIVSLLNHLVVGVVAEKLKVIIVPRPHLINAFIILSDIVNLHGIVVFVEFSEKGAI